MSKLLQKINHKINRYIFNQWPSFSLLYHAVSNDHTNPLTSNNIHNVRPDNFYVQLSEVKRNYKVVFIDELVERIRKKKKITRMCAITFDDGYQSILTHALPILNALEVPATFFVTASLVTHGSFWRDKIRYLIEKNYVDEFISYALQRNKDFAQVETDNFYFHTKDPDKINSKTVAEVLDDFFLMKNIDLGAFAQETYAKAEDLRPHKFLKYGNHTANHFVMSSLSKDQQAAEIQAGEDFLRKLNLQISKCFSIPFGNPGSYDTATVQLLNDYGYLGCLLSWGYKKANIYNHIPSKFSSETICMLNRFMPEDVHQAVI